MKKLLILQMRPEDVTAQSEFEAIIRFSGLDTAGVDRIRLEQFPIPEIELDAYWAIIAGGSPFDVSLPEAKKGAVQKRIERFFVTLFDQIIPMDFPFLGACSGNGHLGKYCGATISSTYAEPIGTVMLNKTEAGHEDPLLSGLPHSFLGFVGHKEACDETPQDAKLLLTSETCPVQMFRIKKNIYATQFHPEADADEFVLRIKTYKDHGYFQPEEADSLISSVKDSKAPETNAILQRFVHRYRR